IGTTGAPIVTENAVAYFEARVTSIMDAGTTHTIFVGEVESAEVLRQEEPMTYAYYHQVKRGSTPKTAPSYIEKKKEEIKMDKYECNVCGYVYDPEIGDPENNVPPGTPFENLPEDWECPVCGASKEEFQKV
ncbi:MAG: rubredoxin, partial [Chloroflexota bacterium]|nr:rubredoxin [Chloroflexota bacterium]